MIASPISSRSPSPGAPSLPLDRSRRGEPRFSRTSALALALVTLGTVVGSPVPALRASPVNPVGPLSGGAQDGVAVPSPSTAHEPGSIHTNVSFNTLADFGSGHAGTPSGTWTLWGADTLWFATPEPSTWEIRPAFLGVSCPNGFGQTGPAYGVGSGGIAFCDQRPIFSEINPQAHLSFLGCGTGCLPIREHPKTDHEGVAIPETTTWVGMGLMLGLLAYRNSRRFRRL